MRQKKKIRKGTRKYKLHLRCRLDNKDTFCFDVRIPGLHRLFKEHLAYSQEKKRYLLPAFDQDAYEYSSRSYEYHLQLLKGDISKGVTITPSRPVARENIDDHINRVQMAVRDIVQEVVLLEREFISNITIPEVRHD